MLSTKRLRLREITLQEYNQVKARIGLPPKVKEWDTSGFAEIEVPLEYQSFYELLEDFVDVNEDYLGCTQRPRRISIPIGKKQWKRTKVKHIHLRELHEMARLAEERRVVYVNFFNDLDNPNINNEIGFEIVDGKVVSACLFIPGEKRSFYDWNGSDLWYKQIVGLYPKKDPKLI